MWIPEFGGDDEVSDIGRPSDMAALVPAVPKSEPFRPCAPYTGAEGDLACRDTAALVTIGACATGSKERRGMAVDPADARLDGLSSVVPIGDWNQPK